MLFIQSLLRDFLFLSESPSSDIELESFHKSKQKKYSPLDDSAFDLCNEK